MMRDRRRIEPRIVAAAAITVLALGALAVSTFVGGDGGVDKRARPSGQSSGAVSTTTGKAGASTTSTSGVAVTVSAPPPTVKLNPAWPTKSVSRYSESDTGATPP